MSELKHDISTIRTKRIQSWTLALAAIAIFLAAIAIIWKPAAPQQSGSGTVAQETALQRIERTGVMRVGYGGFPPYTIINLNNPDPNAQASGYSVDLVDEIAKRANPPLKVQWVKFNWETLKHDVDSGTFDFVAEPVYVTIPRAMDFDFSEPYSYFGIAAAVVKKDDNRFQTFDDLNRSDITIALAAGWTTSDYAQQHLTKPKFAMVSADENAFNQLDYVTLGRADVALNDVPTVAQYVHAHSDTVKALWLNSPPSSVAGGFLMRKDETDLRDFLNSSIEALKADGTLLDLDKKWKTYGFFNVPQLVPGAGLKQN
jgi:L-cystine transport system substrate-binding protein